MNKRLLTFFKNNKIEIRSYSATYEKPGKVPKIRYSYVFACSEGEISGEYQYYPINSSEADFSADIRARFKEMIPNCWMPPHNLPF